jgi:peroxiredoxin
MSIKAGDKMPSGVFSVMTDAGPGAMSTEELFAGKKVVLVSVPGAFTPTCSMNHLPGFVDQAEEIQELGVDTIACMAVNDVFVMDAWGKDRAVDDKVVMLADGNGEYTKKLGLEMDGTKFGLGMRGQRFAMVVEDGTATHVAVEAPGKFEVSKAESILAVLKKSA